MKLKRVSLGFSQACAFHMLCPKGHFFDTPRGRPIHDSELVSVPQ